MEKSAWQVGATERFSCGRNEPSRSARLSASQRGRLAVHRECRIKTLVWYEHYGDARDAIAREKQLKKWERRWKLELIKRFNADGRDLYETLNNRFSRIPWWRSGPLLSRNL